VQARQDPVHAVSQHTPSTQWPDWQAPATAHAKPIGSLGRHVPTSQKCAATQSASEPQGFAHCPAVQTWGAQSVPGLDVQAPNPSQTCPEI
jgi:hypothetical protein